MVVVSVFDVTVVAVAVVAVVVDAVVVDEVHERHRTGQSCINLSP